MLTCHDVCLLVQCVDAKQPFVTQFMAAINIPALLEFQESPCFYDIAAVMEESVHKLVGDLLRLMNSLAIEDVCSVLQHKPLP